MIQKFLQTYKEAFGNAVPLLVTFGYSHIPVTEINKIPRCMIGSIRKVCEGYSLTLSRQCTVRWRKPVHSLCPYARKAAQICVRNGTLQADSRTNQEIHTSLRHPPDG